MRRLSAVSACAVVAVLLALPAAAAPISWGLPGVSSAASGGPRAYVSSTSGGITVTATSWNYQDGQFVTSRVSGDSDWVLYTFSDVVDLASSGLLGVQLEGNAMSANLSADQLRRLTSSMAGSDYSGLQDEFGFSLMGVPGYYSLASSSMGNAVLLRVNSIDPIVGGSGVFVPEPSLLLLMAPAAVALRRRSRRQN
jgi:hypothetical protein